MLLADASGNVIDAPGVTGEILLRSPALFSGYWDDPQATRAALVPDPVQPRSGQLVLRTGDLAYRGERGDLYFCGRKDSQVQIRGNRVELSEIERRLLDFPGVTATAVLLLEQPGGDPGLDAFVVLSPESPTPDASALRAFCAETLPAYMIPRTLRVLDALPTTAHGKIDRQALTALPM
jgi:acyl-coenzyme A synthetase/AMP-(fatty) acid ligase